MVNTVSEMAWNIGSQYYLRLCDWNREQAEIKTSLVMPCTVGEGLTSLPLTLKTIADADTLPHELIVVFGLTKDVTLEDELNKELPKNVNDGIDKTRDMLRHLILSNLFFNDPNDIVIKDSIKINSEKQIESLNPIDYLNLMNITKYFDEKKI